MQSYAKEEVAVGFQRKHDGMIAALKNIYRIRGIRGLYRGVIGNIPRAALGSGAQLATFGPLKEFLKRNNLSLSNPLLNTFVCSAIGNSNADFCVLSSFVNWFVFVFQLERRCHSL